MAALPVPVTPLILHKKSQCTSVTGYPSLSPQAFPASYENHLTHDLPAYITPFLQNPVVQTVVIASAAWGHYAAVFLEKPNL